MDKVLDALGQEGALLGAVGVAFVLDLGRRLKTWGAGGWAEEALDELEKLVQGVGSSTDNNAGEVLRALIEGLANRQAEPLEGAEADERLLGVSRASG